MPYVELIKILFTVIGTSFLTQWLIGRRERSQILFIKKADRFRELEEVTGYLAEQVTRHADDESKADEIRNRFASLDTMCGAFQRYPAVLLGIRDFNKSASWLNSRKSGFETDDEYKNAVSDVGDKHKKLLAACDNELGHKV